MSGGVDNSDFVDKGSIGGKIQGVIRCTSTESAPTVVKSFSLGRGKETTGVSLRAVMDISG